VAARVRHRRRPKFAAGPILPGRGIEATSTSPAAISSVASTARWGPGRSDECHLRTPKRCFRKRLRRRRSRQPAQGQGPEGGGHARLPRIGGLAGRRLRPRDVMPARRVFRTLSVGSEGGAGIFSEAQRHRLPPHGLHDVAGVARHDRFYA
jgi:hypothetical protein